MPQTHSRALFVAAIAVAATATVPAFAATSPQATAILAGVVPSWVATSKVSGVVSPTQTVNIQVALRYRDEPGLANLVSAVSTPGSPQFRHFLSATQFTERFAPGSTSVRAVSGWLSRIGLKVDGVTSSGAVVLAHGPASVVQRALHTTLATFSYQGQSVRAPISPAVIPAALARIVKGITGLDTVRYHPTSQPLATPPPAFLNARPCSTYWGQYTATNQPTFHGKHLLINPCGYSPAQIRGAYGLDKVKQTGAGATVAIIDAYASPTIVSDVNTYSTKHGLPPFKSGQFSEALPQPAEENVPEVSTPIGAVVDPQGWSGEETLDVEAVHTMTPGANIVYVPAASDQNATIDLALLETVENTSAQVISNSYGSSGDSPSPDDKTLFDLAMSQAAVKGITVVFSSGDSGDELQATGKRQADYPASSDMVTALGATSLFVGKNNNYLGEGYWGTLKYLRDGSGWSSTPATGLVGGGGGVSTSYAEPSWQKGVVPNSLATYGGVSPGRVLPDLSIIGDSTTGFLVGQTQAQKGGQNSYSEYRIGGTSVSCPMFAGIIADAIQIAGHGLGLINPVLYKLSGTSAYRDIVPPRSQLAVVRYDYKDTQDPSTALIASLRTLGNLSTLHLTRGFDDATGLGSPVAPTFIPMLAKG